MDEMNKRVDELQETLNNHKEEAIIKSFMQTCDINKNGNIDKSEFEDKFASFMDTFKNNIQLTGQMLQEKFYKLQTPEVQTQREIIES